MDSAESKQCFSHSNPISQNTNANQNGRRLYMDHTSLFHSKLATLACALLCGVECVLRSLPAGEEILGGGCTPHLHEYAPLTYMVSRRHVQSQFLMQQFHLDHFLMSIALTVLGFDLGGKFLWGVGGCQTSGSSPLDALDCTRK